MSDSSPSVTPDRGREERKQKTFAQHFEEKYGPLLGDAVVTRRRFFTSHLSDKPKQKTYQDSWATWPELVAAEIDRMERTERCAKSGRRPEKCR